MSRAEIWVGLVNSLIVAPGEDAPIENLVATADALLEAFDYRFEWNGRRQEFVPVVTKLKK